MTSAPDAKPATLPLDMLSGLTTGSVGIPAPPVIDQPATAAAAAVYKQQGTASTSATGLAAGKVSSGQDKVKREKAEYKADHGAKRQHKRWLLITLCALGISLPVGFILLLVAYKRRVDASQGPSASGQVATQDPDDDEPDSPRAADPYASAFTVDDEEDNGKF